jgi:solute carrier family 39 (zinc transporter), member 1/2/3
MDLANDLARLAARQTTATPACDTGNDYNGRIGLRIAALFIIWITSTVGAVFPIYANRHKGMGVPEWTFFVAKYFGSGVIVATAFIHLLSPAEDALRNPCLTGAITEYSWVEGIILMTIFVLFFVELMVMRYGNFGAEHEHEHEHSHAEPIRKSPGQDSKGILLADEQRLGRSTKASLASEQDAFDAVSAVRSRSRNRSTTHAPGEDHLGHARQHTDIEDVGAEDVNNPFTVEDYKAQMTAIFILEFGIIFHSVFIGLTLAVAGAEFNTLFVVLIFHQTFEGLGLGSRLAVTPWPKPKKWTPYILGVAYGVSTPLAIAIGLGVRKSYPPGSQTTLIVNGVFDSVSAGILIYTGLVELMAHEFMFSHAMRKAELKVVLAAFGLMCLGAGLMALLGKWA